MAKVGDIFPSKFLKAPDFKGKSVTLTVKAAPVEESFGTHKPVLYFHETEKAFSVSPTNARILTSFLEQDDTDNWPGAVVTLTPTKRVIAGEVKDVVDVTAARFPAQATPQRQAAAAPAGVPTRQAPPPVDDDEIPF